MAITPAAPGEIQPPNSLTPDNAGSISAPNNLSAESAGDIAVPNTLTPDSVGAIDTPNSLSANAAGSVGAPNSLTAESSGEIGLPNALSAEAAGGVSAPNALSSETVGDIQPPNVLAPDTVGQIAIPNVLASQGASVLPRTLRPLFELNFASQIYADCNEAVAFNDIVTYTRASSGTYIDRVAKCTSGYDYILKTAINDEARFEYDPVTGESLGLLIEGASTNSQLFSSNVDESNAGWNLTGGGVANTGVITPNFALAPNGVMEASRVVMDLNGGVSSSDQSGFQSTFSSTNPSTTTYSIYLKSNTSETYQVRFDFNGSNPDVGGGIIDITPEWQRFVMTLDIVSADRVMILRLRGSQPTSDTADILVWGGQSEELPFASSYIKTTTSSATRAADNVTLDADKNLPSLSEPWTFSTNINLSGFPSGNSALFGTDNNPEEVRLYIQDDGSLKLRDSVPSTNTLAVAGSFVEGVSYDVHVVYNGVNAACYINGLIQNTPNVTMRDIIGGSLYIGTSKFGESMYGTQQKSTMYETALTAAEVAKLAGV